MVTLEDIKKNELVGAYLKRADEQLGVIGYTEHGPRHADLVAHIAYNVLSRLERTEREAQLAAIAGYLHDIGNVVSRVDHAQTGAIIAQSILADMGMSPDEYTGIMAAIGNHHEQDGNPVSDIAAALILADKSDVHKTRVRNPELIKFDIHDRVNYAAQNSFLRVDGERRALTLEVTIDTDISPVMEYFEIFLSRMVIARRAADFLGCAFELLINGIRLF
ncbi:phosphohydrolase [candidate division TA06 bacterium DG_24]|jgi:metal-dependent HD superfamily phosphatase/phosphodiesterase|uniref:Phosphohydrolase n=3 Tax=Bacteria division TA06 TaxID=1156500 RepID=A0A0S8JQS1_UNCT6|nr:MAG: phosphohydrolase [candidate division TA06 bacterium DG_24]KPK70047.1 MAG: phosphohydrolase [candidate division TA06 bacterium SM23_40]KPL11539.1 MAG: phosphohydrolase [candidate division TA06 bacterium SM1_40]